MINEKPIHWVEEIAEKICQAKKEPYIVNSGMTTSGSPHMGTVCEFLYPSIIYTYLKNSGKKSMFFFQIDIMDAFDNIPMNMKNHESMLKQHLGKPLCNVPDPLGCCNSYGEHFLNEAVEVIKALKIEMPIFLKAQDLYSEGKYDKYAILFFEHLDEVKEIIEKTSMRKLKNDWSPIMPICKNCGKIATTRILSFDVKTGNYEYADDKDIRYTKGCGYIGNDNIKNHQYKITWRLDWPSRQDFLEVTVEGSGVDHMTKGGSWDTAYEIHKKIFKKEGPIPYRYGFIMLEGKKYSKSKGTGFTVKELLEIMPAEVLKFALLKPDIQENIDFKTNPIFMLRLIEDYSASVDLLRKIDEGTLSFKDLRRHEQKNVAAAKLSGVFIFNKSLTELFMYKSIYKNWDIIENIIGHVDTSLKLYTENWILKKLVPDDYSFSYSPKPDTLSKEFILQLNENMTPIDIHNAVFEFAKKKKIEPSILFQTIYTAIISKPKGPKLGKLIHAIGINKIKQDFNV